MNKILRISIVVVILLIVILAVVLIVGQCSAPEENPPVPPVCTTHVDADTNYVCDNCGEELDRPNPPACTDHVDADTNYVCDNCGAELEKPNPPACTDHVDNNNDYVCDVCQTQLEKPNDGFIATNDKVYVISSELNLRKTPDETGVATVSVVMDTMLERIGYYATGDNAGLSQVTYENELYYVATDYVTTQKPMTDEDFTTVEETVYVIAGKNPLVFSKPSHIEKHQYSEQIGTLISGQTLTRLGVATKVYVDDEGVEYTFAKVRYEFNGETFTGYVNNAHLTTEANLADCGIAFTEDTSVLVVIADSFTLRTSAEFPENSQDNVGGHVNKDTELQATHVGVTNDGETWYKVVVEGQTYYIFYNTNFVTLKTPAAE